MKRPFTAVCFIVCAAIANAQTNTRNQLFDDNWRFIKDSTIQAEVPGFDDSKWRKIDLPHDWSIEDLPNQTTESIIGPFDKRSTGGGATGYTDGGTGWYRKQFVISKADEGKQISIQFDGVYMNSDAWLNGHHLGNHPYGYTPFYYDLTPYLNPAGQQNVLAVRVRNEGKNSRWYSGSGIYRHVWLVVTAPVHIVPYGVYITTPAVSSAKATVQLQSTISNSEASAKKLQLVTTIYAGDGKAVGYAQTTLTIEPNTANACKQNITVTSPNLWSVETPNLYRAVTEIKYGAKTIDRVETPFGIRSLSFTTENGFLLNGKNVLLKGGCIHNDDGPLGSATIDHAEERKIEILKQNGFNAIRTSHNPPSKQLLDACDRLGMLVLDEAFDMWEVQKNPQDYHLYFKDWWKKDLDAMILRDRNHPSVILWSIGNEVPERVDDPGLRIARQLVDETHQLDATRPVTEAICSFWDHPGYKWDTTAAAFGLLDVGGYNYMLSEYEEDHRKFPGRIMAGTESFPIQALENWNMVEKHPYVIGDFVWTAFDYMGEASIGNATLNKGSQNRMFLGWPWYDAWCGDIDLIGNKKPQSYYRDVVWRNKPIAMAVHSPIPAGMMESVSMWGWPDELQSWTWPGEEGKPLQVRVFSRAPMVRLLLNGQVLGEQKMGDHSITAVFTVPYQPGVLKAVNVVDGKETDAVELNTTGQANHIRLVADRAVIHADRNDLSYVMVEVMDDKGQVVPNASLPVHFTITGAGEIAGVGNADPTGLASFQQPEINTFRGKCLVIVRPLGKVGTITLEATAGGLPSTKVVITTR
ncbi:MAG TPA: glycoside hydrolase family 2 TIM barrel-domain containing protein [Chitinophagaceae bacterium]|nr:glycoside hydrolase family 2 TIM barrel-domain containing protein [Chitinophagaceae bacterium]